MSSVKYDSRSHSSSLMEYEQSSRHDTRSLHSSSLKRKREDNSKVISNKTKKKRLISNYNESRQQEIRDANRIAARQCRQRKKELATGLEQTINFLSAEYSFLSFQNQVLTNWKRILEASHQNVIHGQMFQTKLQIQQQLQQSILELSNPGLPSMMASGTVQSNMFQKHPQQHLGTPNSAFMMSAATSLQLSGQQTL